ncbi:MAG: hypothetical protein C0622_02305 [Desulfuromonas sp.]|nr:MAG: hypothetical protein C0622_02305 [Desulfuromonas sp.]
MNLEREAMKGRLAGLKEQRSKLRLKAEGDCLAIRTGLNTALIDIDDLEIPMVAEQMDQLTIAWGELQAVNIQIARLEKELG